MKNLGVQEKRRLTFYEMLAVTGTFGIWLTAFGCVGFGVYAFFTTGTCKPPATNVIEAKIVYEDNIKIAAEMRFGSIENIYDVVFSKGDRNMTRSKDGKQIILFEKTYYFCRRDRTFIIPNTDINYSMVKYDIYENSKEELNPEITNIIIFLACILVVFCIIVILGLYKSPLRIKQF